MSRPLTPGPHTTFPGGKGRAHCRYHDWNKSKSMKPLIPATTKPRRSFVPVATFEFESFEVRMRRIMRHKPLPIGEQEPSLKRQSGRREWGARILANLRSFPSHSGGNGHTFSTFGTKRPSTRRPAGLMAGGRARLAREKRAYDPREFNNDFGRADPAEDGRVAARSARIPGGNKAVGKQPKLTQSVTQSLKLTADSHIERERNAVMKLAYSFVLTSTLIWAVGCTSTSHLTQLAPVGPAL